MKAASIRLKITLWFTGALLLVVGLTLAITLSVGDSVLQKGVRDNLIELISHNYDEVEFYTDADDILRDNDDDHYIAYRGGYLEIDDDYLDTLNGVYAALYEADGVLLYGANPIARESAGLDFAESQLQRVPSDGTTWYIFDRALSGEGLEGLWLRGVVSSEQGRTQLTDVTRTSLILMPVLLLVAVFGGMLIAGRMLRPIQNITETAARIAGSGDTKQRIILKNRGNDELHRLADTFNQMLARLDSAFETERRFTADASHELRTPMTVIQAQCEYALEQPRDEEEYREALVVIGRQGSRMSKLIQDMLDFSRLERRPEQYPKKPLDFSALAADVCEDMALIREKGIVLTHDCGKAIMMEGNELLLQRLLANLIGNAYRYGREDGKIAVTLTEDAKAIRLTVTDDGIGVAAEEQERIFNRFYQTDASHSGKGSGLGLSMVREIARFHGGTVSVQSALGEGSSFRVIFSKA